jgi:glutaredoxin
MQKNNTAVKTDSGLFGRGTIAVIIGIVALLVIFLLMSVYLPGSGAVVPPAICGERVISYLNSNVVQQGTTVSLISINETKGLYALKSQYRSQEITIYATKDCTLVFTNTIDMNATPSGTAQSQPPKKSARPVVDLYVMAFCPYGTQAEAVMRPVVDLLGTTTDIHVRYITTINGPTTDNVTSLHGPTEAKEDLRQVCILKSTPQKYWDYLKAFNDQCYPLWQNTSAMDSCRKNVTASMGIDLVRTESCAVSPDGLALLKADETDATKYGVSGSPTLIINGVEYAGARTPEAYKQAICNSFDNAPAVCNTTLSTDQVTNAAGGCG